jgi:hypothetical protein
VWLEVLTRLQTAADAEQIITWDVSVDLTVCRAHQHAAGVRKREGSDHEWRLPY